MSLVLPFVGRREECVQLERLHAQHKHVLIIGPAGVGKTALITEMAGWLPFLVCPQSVRLSGICTSLENQLELEAGGQRLVPRKNRLLRALREAGQTIVFDGVAWMTPRLSSFVESVMERATVWIAARSEHSRDIGRIWPLLVRFVKIDIKPLSLAETRDLIEAAIRLGYRACRCGGRG